MAKNNTVNFINPYADNAIENQLIYKKALRRQELAQALIQQAMQPSDNNTQVISGVAVKNSPLGGLVNVLKGYVGYKMMDDADKNIVGMENEATKSNNSLISSLFENNNRISNNKNSINVHDNNNAAANANIEQPVIKQPQPLKLLPQENNPSGPLTFDKKPYTPISLDDLKNPNFYNKDKEQRNNEAVAIREMEIANAHKKNDPNINNLKKALNVFKNGKMSENANNPQPFITAISRNPLQNENIVNKPFMPELEIEKQQPQSQQMQPQINVPMPFAAQLQSSQEAIPPQAPINNQIEDLTPQQFWMLNNQYPDVLPKILENRFTQTNEMKNRAALGISNEQAKIFEMAKMSNEADGKLNEKGMSAVRDASGSVIGYKPINGFDTIQGQNQYTESYNKTAAENAASMPYKQQQADIELAKTNAAANYKANLDNRNSIKEIQMPNGQFVNTTAQQIIDNVNSGKPSVAKLSTEETVARKNHQQHYAQLSDKNKLSPKNIALGKEIIDLSNLAGIGTGAEFRNKYATYLKALLPNVKIDSLTNQQLVQAAAAKMANKIIQENGGLGRMTDSDFKNQMQTLIDPNATPDAIKSAAYTIIGDEYKNQQDYKKASTLSNNGKDFTQYQAIYEAKPFNKHINIINAFNGDKQAQANYINNLPQKDREELIKSLKNKAK